MAADAAGGDKAVEDYLERSGVDAYAKDALTLLLENRPEEPIRFLAE
jgi:hypothetical protein